MPTPAEAPIVHAARNLGNRIGPRAGAFAAGLTRVALPGAFSDPDDPKRSTVNIIASDALEAVTTFMPAFVAYLQHYNLIEGAAVGLAAYAIDRVLMMGAHASHNHSGGPNETS